MQKKNLRFNYEIIYEDNQMSPKLTASSTQKLISMDNVHALLSFWGIMGNVVASIADQKGVISMTCTFGENSTKGKYNFNFNPTYKSQAEVLVSELKKRKIKTLAAFIDNSDMLHQYETIADEINKNSDIKIVFFEKFNFGEKDYKMAIAKANAKKPDMYLISGYNPSVYLFLKQLKEITGRNDNVTSVDVFMEISPENIHIVDGLWYVDSMGNKAYQKMLKDKTGLASEGCTGATVSNFEILVDAFENADIDAGDKIPNNDNISKYIWSAVQDKDTIPGKATIINDGQITVEPRIKVMNSKD